MSTVPEITQEDEKSTSPQNQQTMSTTSPEITQNEATPASSTATGIAPATETAGPPNNSTQLTNTRNKKTESSAMTTNSQEITQEDEKATSPQNQQAMSTTSPETTQKEATQASTTATAQETASPPPALDNSTQPTNTQNQKIESSAPEIKQEDTTKTTPPDSIKPTTNNQNQEKPSSVPDIKQGEKKELKAEKKEITAEEALATPRNPPENDSSAQSTTKTTDDQNKSNQTDTIPKEDSTTKAQKQETLPSAQEFTPEKASKPPTQTTTEKTDEIETTPIEDSTTTTTGPQNEIPKQDSASGATITQTEIPKKNEAPKQDSTNIAPLQTDKTDTDTDHSKIMSICNPLAGIFRSKEKKSQPKKPIVVQDGSSSTISTKDEQSKSTHPQKPVVVQDSATTSGKEEHPKSTDPQKPSVVQDSAITPTKDKQSKLTDPQKPNAVQDSATTSTKDEQSKSTEPQKPVIAQDSATTSGATTSGEPSSGIDEISKSIEADIKYIMDESNRLDKYKGQVIQQVREAEQRFEELKNVGIEKEFRDLKKEVTKLKLQIPSKHKADTEDKDPHKSQQATGVASKLKQKAIPELVMKEMPQLYKSSLFENSSELKDFEALFQGLSVELKLCLLCFSVFPEKAIIKKRLMVYWWMAEGFVPPILRDDETRQQISGGKTADEYFQKLVKMGFIEPVNKKRSLFVGCYTLHPFVRLALIMIAEKAKFFNFDEAGEPTEKSSGTFQACLMGRGLIDYQDLQKGNVNVQDLDKLHAVFNVNEQILDFKPEWFSRMKNLNVLYLGRWKVSATDHIEVEESKFLDGLSTMEHLKFFSLQGVSTIVELPESIEKLSNLIIMDLRACHSLESIPEGIRYLKNLSYLDISECYLLEHMPKGLAMLFNLRVLKGFVVGEEQDKHTCSLDDLAKLEKLIKLSIYTGLGEFPTDEDIKALENFKVLKKLTMAWGGSALHTKSKKTPESPKRDDGGQKKKETPARDNRKKQLMKLVTFRDSTATRPAQLEKLEKLDLKSFPKTATPSWLKPSRLKSLKKLYIRGGKFSDIYQYQDLYVTEKDRSSKEQWENVEILRLKYLSELEMDWRKLQELFPNLVYLEKVNCPKLSFFPSDGYGVWINKDKLKQMPMRT
ncbi:hypothetical protein ACH5RR_014981 [Cinchona calisaya]|uniref:Uncharacterized protein n=1 Tax=Cinchona calisaya TaxID=153742 RepID=A0ABD2ZRU0_9GENT